MKFRSKPTVIEAEQFTDESKPPRGVKPKDGGGGFYIETAGDTTTAHVGDWIIAEPLHPGKYYPCEPKTFAQKYEPESRTRGPSAAELLYWLIQHKATLTAERDPERRIATLDLRWLISSEPYSKYAIRLPEEETAIHATRGELIAQKLLAMIRQAPE